MISGSHVFRVANVVAALASAVLAFGRIEAVELTPGDLVVGDSRSPVRVSVVNPITRVKTNVCDCATLNTIRDVAVRGTDRIYAIGQLAGEIGRAHV